MALHCANTDFFVQRPFCCYLSVVDSARLVFFEICATIRGLLASSATFSSSSAMACLAPFGLAWRVNGETV